MKISATADERGDLGQRFDLRLSVLRILVGAAALALAVTLATVAVVAGSDPGTLAALTTIVRIVSSCLCVLAGVLRLSLHDLTGHRDSTVLGVGLLLVGGTLLPSSVITTLLASPFTGLEPVVRTIETLILLTLMTLYVDRRGHLTRQPKDVLLVVGPLIILGGAVTAAIVYLTSSSLATGPSADSWLPLGGVLPTLAWVVVAMAMSVQSWPPGGREALVLAWVSALSCALRAVGYAATPALVLVAAFVVLVAAITAAARAMRDLDDASSAARQEAAARATLLADTRLDLTEEAARVSALRHDALNSLAALRAAIECLRVADPSSEDRSEHVVRAALGEVGHLEHLLTRRGQSEPVSFAVDEVIAGIVDSRRPTGLDVDFDPSGEVAWGVPGDFATVLQNLLVNAHVHGGGRDVRVRCRADDGYLDVRVHDRGPGVPHAARPAIFERGVRASDRPGAGLGLHISRQLMREQGGDVLLEPAARGAAFSIRIPLAREEHVRD